MNSSPAEHSMPPYEGSHPLIVFDGVCVLCSGWFRFVIRHDSSRRFRFALAQSPLGQALYRHYRLDPVEFQTNLVIVDGRLHTELDAFAAVMTQLPAPWRLLSVARYLPKSIGDFLYFRIARNRYRWFGRTEVCMIPSPELRSRFAPDGWL